MKRLLVRWLLGCVLVVTGLGFGGWAALRVPSIYLRVALFLIQHEAYYRDNVDWKRVKSECFALVKQARSPTDTYPAIRHALSALGDHHSFLMAPISIPVKQAWAAANRPPSVRAVGDHIGYLELPGLAGDGRLADGRQYAEVAHVELGRLASRGPPCGWILDLRRNSGGNMWPMLAAVGPILGEGRVGYFATRQSRIPWSYAGGLALLAGRVVAKVEIPCPPPQPLRPVAILTSPNTASAGEAIVVAFRGRPGTRFFGEPTAGVPTANQPFPLPDGAKLVLMVGLDADREGQTYDSPIPPDEHVSVKASEIGQTTDRAIDVAADWLGSQLSCTKE